MKQETKQGIHKGFLALAAALCLCMALVPGLALGDDSPGTYAPGTIGSDESSSSAASPSTTFAVVLDGPDDLSLTYGYAESSKEGALSVTPKVTGATKYDVTYQWYSNTKESATGGTLIKDATSASYTIPKGLTAGDYYYYCVATASTAELATSSSDASSSTGGAATDTKQEATATSAVATVTIEKADQDAPTTVNTVNVTVKGKKDGILRGLTTAMEYRKVADDEGDSDDAADEPTWTACTETTVSGLEDGTYEVRFKETENYNESEPAEVTIYWDVTTSVTVGSNAPTVTCDNFDDVALAYKRANQYDAATTVALDLVVSPVSNPSNNSDAKKIIAIATGKDLAYFDLTMKRSLKSADPTTITDLGSNVMAINVPFTTKDRNNITAYRVHDSKASALRSLSQKPSSGYTDGTYYVGDGSVTIYASKFSVYALGFDSKSATDTRGSTTMPATGDTLPPIAIVAAIVVLAVVAMVVARRFIKRA